MTRARKSEQVALLDAPTEVDHARAREYSFDPTPRLLVRHGLARVFSCRATDGRSRVYCADALIWSEHEGTFTVLDVCAGAGVWASEMRRLLEQWSVPCCITGLDNREEEVNALARWCDYVAIDDAVAYLAAAREHGHTWHAVIGNPAFQLLRPEVDGRTSRPSIMDSLLACSRATVLYHASQAFQRSAWAYAWLDANRPVLECRVSGPVKHRNGFVLDADGQQVLDKKGKPKKYSADTACYSVTAWVQHGRHPMSGQPWACDLLLLPDEARRWVEMPGRELAWPEPLPVAPMK